MKPMDLFPTALIQAAPVRGLAEGEALFRQGDATFAIFAVESGRLQLVRHATQDRTVILHSAGAGELLAEAALFSEVYHCDAIAAAPSRVRVLSRARLLEAMRSDAAVAERFMAMLAWQVQKLRTKVQQRDIRSARERLQQHLLLHAAADGTVAFDGKLKDLASEIGLTPEALYRTLAHLEKQGAIERTGTRIILKNAARK
jgi:CRP-like cAMP-binding protein